MKPVFLGPSSLFLLHLQNINLENTIDLISTHHHLRLKTPWEVRPGILFQSTASNFGELRIPWHLTLFGRKLLSRVNDSPFHVLIQKC